MIILLKMCVIGDGKGKIFAYLLIILVDVLTLCTANIHGYLCNNPPNRSPNASPGSIACATGKYCVPMDDNQDDQNTGGCCNFKSWLSNEGTCHTESTYDPNYPWGSRVGDNAPSCNNAGANPPTNIWVDKTVPRGVANVYQWSYPYEYWDEEVKQTAVQKARDIGKISQQIPHWTTFLQDVPVGTQNYSIGISKDSPGDLYATAPTTADAAADARTKWMTDCDINKNGCWVLVSSLFNKGNLRTSLIEKMKMKAGNGPDGNYSGNDLIEMECMYDNITGNKTKESQYGIPKGIYGKNCKAGHNSMGGLTFCFQDSKLWGSLNKFWSNNSITLKKSLAEFALTGPGNSMEQALCRRISFNGPGTIFAVDGDTQNKACVAENPPLYELCNSKDAFGRTQAQRKAGYGPSNIVFPTKYNKPFDPDIDGGGVQLATCTKSSGSITGFCDKTVLKRGQTDWGYSKYIQWLKTPEGGNVDLNGYTGRKHRWDSSQSPYLQPGTKTTADKDFINLVNGAEFYNSFCRDTIDIAAGIKNAPTTTITPAKTCIGAPGVNQYSDTWKDSGVCTEADPNIASKMLQKAREYGCGWYGEPAPTELPFPERRIECKNPLTPYSTVSGECAEICCPTWEVSNTLGEMDNQRPLPSSPSTSSPNAKNKYISTLGGDASPISQWEMHVDWPGWPVGADCLNCFLQTPQCWPGYSQMEFLKGGGSTLKKPTVNLKLTLHFQNSQMLII